jgi:hypothetical protein
VLVLVPSRYTSTWMQLVGAAPGVVVSMTSFGWATPVALFTVVHGTQHQRRPKKEGLAENKIREVKGLVTMLCREET